MYSNNRCISKKATSNGAKKLKIHFIGIGGIGVSALAQYYLAKGHKVSGSDLVSSEITDALKKKGVAITCLEPGSKQPDLVVYSPAVPKDNPELKQAYHIQNTGYDIRIMSYPEALGKLTKEHFTIAVSGTHGKSTTTAMIALILIKAGLDPTVIIGTKLKEFGDTNFRAGKSKYLVIEADEHMASFLNYWPKIIVLTNIEADHLDFYKNLNNILKTFKEYVSHLPNDGILIANKDDKNIQRILNPKSEIRNPKQILNSKFQILNYSLKQPEAKKLKRILKIPGEHNVYNALAALTLARTLKIPDKISFKALSEYKGAWRRFEIIQTKPFVLISDYGHNPTKAMAGMKTAKEKYPKKKIWCVYQPHQYQRTYYLFKEFVEIFKKAPVDNLIITDIFDVAGREEKETKKKINSQKLVKAINQSSVIYLPKKEIVDYLKRNVKNGEVVIIMGAGDIYKLVDCFCLTENKNKKKI